MTVFLLTHIFDNSAHLLAPPMATWLASSRRFAVFVTTFRDKIRKKLRAIPDAESLLDLRLELETAYLLLQERSLSLVYEPQQIGKVRGPDFAVTFTTSLTFTVEVTRLRADPNTKPSLVADRVADTMCDKLGQLLPQRSNVLVVGVEALDLVPGDLGAAILHTQQRAERNDVAFLQRHRLHNRADFFHHYQRLSEVLVRGACEQDAEPMIAWINPQANHPLPSKVRTALHRSQAVTCARRG